MRINDEFINGNDGCTYRCIRTSGTDTYEIQLVANKHNTFVNLLNTKGQDLNLNSEDLRIMTAANWIKGLFNTNPRKGKNDD